jgi:hypothetical protein
LFFDKKRKQQFIPIPFNIVDIIVKISSRLIEMEGFFESFNMKEVESCSGFDPERIFTTHMVSIVYASIFDRLEEIAEGGDDNEDSHIEANVMSTSSKDTPKKKKKIICTDSHTKVSSNVGAIEVPLSEKNKKT